MRLNKRRLNKLVHYLIPPIMLVFFYKLKYPIKFLLNKKSIACYDKLHLACGKNILDGWANIDLSGQQPIITMDLTNPFPIASNTMKFIYNEHFIEHITLDQARQMLSECYRVLQPGGIIRVSTPDLRKLIDAYLAGSVSEWTDVNFTPLTPCQMMNEGMRSWGHQFVYDDEELQKLFTDCGFREMTHVTWHESRHPTLRGLECRPNHSEIILEATK